MGSHILKYRCNNEVLLQQDAAFVNYAQSWNTLPIDIEEAGLLLIIYRIFTRFTCTCDLQ